MATPKENSFTGAGASANTVIGPSILINGRLTGDEDLTVRGRVEGELTLSRTLIVETSGVVKANVSVKNAIISGVVVGNIAATESVELTREGRMVGDIKAPRVIIVDGASFRGRVDMGELEPGRQVAARPVVRPTVTRAIPAPPPTPVRAVPGKTPASPPRPPAPPPKPEVKPIGKAATPPTAAPPAPPPPPKPPLVAEAAKRKVILRKKGK
jgi:cytoskeletal protein CcmA (bactofilin family)